MYNKTIIRFGFCDIQNNQGLGKGYQPHPLSSADNPYLNLDYSEIISQKPHPIIFFIIHSKYFPVSDWLKPHAQFTITSCC